MRSSKPHLVGDLGEARARFAKWDGVFVGDGHATPPGLGYLNRTVFFLHDVVLDGPCNPPDVRNRSCEDVLAACEQQDQAQFNSKVENRSELVLHCNT